LLQSVYLHQRCDRTVHGTTISHAMASNRSSSPSTDVAVLALAISQQEWSQLGLGKDPSVATSKDLNVTVDRLTALMLIRIAAWIQPFHTYKDLSTTTICRHIIADSTLWPKALTQQVVDEMRLYVQTILKGYQKVPYHNFQHCYHVSISVNKIMDMIIQPASSYNPNNADEPPPDTYGFKDDPLMQLAMLFAALVHDVEHKGIPNRQLANEDDKLAILYNDTAIAEQHSLCLSFSEFLSPTYGKLRETLFPEKDDYRRFRKAVVNLVMCTDIADPERSQLTKSKWKEAFGDPYETIERKVRKAMKAERTPSGSGNVNVSGGNVSVSGGNVSGSGNVSGPPRRVNRRMSTQYMLSDMTGGEDHMISDDSSVSLSASSDDDEPLEHKEIETIDPSPSKPEQYSSPIFQPKRIPSVHEAPVFEVPLNEASGVMPLRRANSYQPPSGNQHGRKPGRRNRRSSIATETDTTDDRRRSGMASKFRRRMSKEGDDSKKRNVRLGLMRTVDLTGEEIQTFNATRRTSAAPGTQRETQPESPKNSKGDTSEETKELRETVLMETILLACDVAHNLQSWEQMAKWSNRLFMELRKAYVHGRGMDPTDGWYNNQIGFLEMYLLPLARRLDDTGAFGDKQGAMFADIIYENRDRWGREGMSLTANIIKTGNEVFPEDESETGWSC
jgi:hypothetical protein